MLARDSMNAEEVARFLHIGKNSVYQMAKSGELASYRIGRKLRFTMDDVQAYLASTRTGGTTRASAPVHDGDGRFVAGAEMAIGAPGGGIGAVARSDAFFGDAQARGCAAADASNALLQAGAPVRAGVSPQIAAAATFGKSSEAPFIIAGNDAAGDLLSNFLNNSGTPVSRMYCGSYVALVNLYAGQADAALVHLFDLKSNSYNVPYVQRLVPGVSVVVVRLYRRRAGFVVARGNPKGITTWGALLREGVRLANRERGCGSRILLDEKLRALEARAENILGYEQEHPSAYAAAARVAAGASDVALAAEQVVQRVEGVDFIPLQNEWVDVALVKNPRTRPFIREMKKLVATDAFARELALVCPGDAASLGAIVYES